MAPVASPPYTWVRTVIGAVVRPAVMNRSFAALLINWSAAIPMKSMIMISATGNMPSMAAPMAAPTMAASEIGVSRTLSWPYFVDNPAVRSGRTWVGDVLAEQEHAVVGFQGLVEREVQCLAHRHFSFAHDRLPQAGNAIALAYTSLSNSSTVAASAAMTVFSADSTAISAPSSM